MPCCNAFMDGSDHIQVERFAAGTGFFGAVEHGDHFDGGRKGFEQMLDRERPVQVHGDHARLFAPFLFRTRGSFFGRFCAGAHDDDHPFGIGCAGVIEQVILPPGYAGELIHRFLHDAGQAL